MPEVLSPELVLVSPDLRQAALLALPEEAARSRLAPAGVGAYAEPQTPRRRQLWATAVAYLAMQLLSSLIWSAAAVGAVAAAATVVGAMR